MRDAIQFGGTFVCERRKSGLLVSRQSVRNMVVNGALNDILNVYFRSASAHANWYIGLIDTTAFGALAATDTIGSHGGWQEYTGYSQGARQAWSTATATGEQLTSVSASVFSFTSPAVIHGVFVVSDSTKGGTTGQLWSQAVFTTDETMSPGEDLRVYYTLPDGSAP